MLLNAFSLNMISQFPAKLEIHKITIDQARTILFCQAESMGESDLVISAVGHTETAAIFSQQLGMPIPVDRQTVKLAPGASAVVGQYIGPRLPEGATQLPSDACIHWFAVHIQTDISPG